MISLPAFLMALALNSLPMIAEPDPGCIASPCELAGLEPPAACGILFTSPLGPGSVQIDISGCLGTKYMLAITLNAGNYPSGWFFGIDISPAELLAEVFPLWTNYPFNGPLTGGGITIGPYTGLPSGLTAYVVVLAFSPPTHVDTSTAVSYVIP